MKRICSLIIMSVIILSFSLNMASAQTGQIPCRFHGTVTIDSASAPVGTTVVASIAGDTFDTETPSAYGASTYSIEIEPPDGATYDEGEGIVFYVGSDRALQTASWETGGNKVLNLTVSSTATPTPTPTETSSSTPTPTPTSTPIPTPEPGVIDIEINESGETSEDIIVTYEDKPASLSIPGGNAPKDSAGEALTQVIMKPNDTPPLPQDDQEIVGQAYALSPTGATFDPPITLTIEYNPNLLPERVSEDSLVIAFYDIGTGDWTELESTVNSTEQEVTAEVSHFTSFAIIGTVESAPLSIWVIVGPILVLAVVIGMSLVLLRFY